MLNWVRNVIKRSRKIVPLMIPGYEGQDATDIKGGMTIYYTQKDFNSSDLQNHITAFPPVSRKLVSKPR
jgi:hypothetical protein